MKSSIIPQLMAVGLGFAATGSARAASTTWNNTGTDFNTGANWSNNVPGAADSAVFSGPAGGQQPDLSADKTISSLNFSGSDASGYKISGSGGSLILNSVNTSGTLTAIYADNTSGTNTISAAVVLGGAANSTAMFKQFAGGTLAISGNISSTNAIGGVILSGSGTTGVFTLSGSNSYSGDTTLDGNGFRTRLNINSAHAISSGKLIIAATAELDNTSGAAITLANNNNIDLAGTLRFLGTNDLSFGSGVLNIITSSTGTLTLNAGTLAIGSINATSTTVVLRKTGPGTLVISGAANPNFQGGSVLEGGTLIVGDKNALGSGALTLAVSSTLASSVDLSGANAISNDILLSKSGLTIGGSNNLQIAGKIEQSVGTARILEIANSGTTILSNTANSYLGATRVTKAGAVLEVTKLANGESESSIGASTNAAANLLISDGATLRYVGTGDSTDRLFQISGAAGTTATLDASGSGAVAFTNTGALSHSSSNLARTLKLTGTNTGNNSIAATLANNGSGALSITKEGKGTWVLAGANTYTGNTTVTAGTLVVAGAISNSSAVMVGGGSEFRYNSASARTGALTLNGAGNSSRAILSGTGAINVALTLNNVGDTLSPGNSPGSQTFGVSQSWDAFTYVWETNDFTGTTAGTDFDQIIINGGLTLNGSGTFQLDLRSLTAGNTAGNVANFLETNTSWTILTTTGGVTGFNAANWTLLTGNFTTGTPWKGQWSIDQQGNDLVLSYAAVPEPSSIGLMISGVATGLCLLSRARRRAA